VDRGVPVLCGALTPTEVLTAIDAGVDAVKLFPVSSMGSRYVKDLRAPFPRTPFIPVGGVGTDEAARFLADGAVAVGVASPLLGDAANGGDLDALRERARRFLKAVQR
ncbi:MAG: bifunctional 4-hydroxy-2-oxoglutarate aldolase/2-dehydro-3-deoxy-phosphogluconate aldolase, partial [Microbacterium gubbeenense]